MLFNLLPIPPLDGSKVLYLFLENRPDIIQIIERYSFFVLIAILFLASNIILTLVIGPALQLTSIFSGLSLFEIQNLIT